MEAVLNFQPVIDLTEEQFFDFCQLNRDVCIERNAKGEVLVMPPTGGATGARNAEITMQLRLWAKYRRQIPVAVRENLNALLADPPWPEFVLNLSEIW